MLSSDLPSDWALSEDTVSELKDKSIEITERKKSGEKNQKTASRSMGYYQMVEHTCNWSPERKGETKPKEIYEALMSNCTQD